MGFFQNFLFCFKTKHLIISLTLILISSLTHKSFMAQGRSVPISPEVIKVREREEVIGSRPPRCERRCSSCVHCKAVQVPIIPHLKLKSTETLNSRSDDLSNYKPISWKCKCGNLILNP